MPLRIGDEAPDFTADTTEGTIKFHEWIGNGWAILFSHPKDFTPVCTTELGYMAGLKPEFDKRNTKIVGLSIDPVSDHKRWVGDIEETQGHKVNYPLIGDPDLDGGEALRHDPSERERRRAADRGGQCDGPLGVRRRAGQEDQADADLPDEHRAQLRRGAARARLDAAHGEAQGGDAGELEAAART